MIPDGNCFCAWYDNTRLGGRISFNGVDTWSCYSGMRDSDQSWGRTGLIEVYADCGTSLENTTWGSTRSVF
ncbi:MAG: hypothetical protein AVO35_03310 [Candidatus Aegiribacteria sp. MLS_C]|nr:MAG: hypothetical protein AVO35_03310 [Candidatus Aegiribacteria sp. MLS_C]